MPWHQAGGDLGHDPRPPESAEAWSPDQVVMVASWLGKAGGGVNTVTKDQIDYLTHVHKVPVAILVERGDYVPGPLETFVTFPDFGDSDSIYGVLQRHIVDPAAMGRRIAVIIHNILTVPYHKPLDKALRRMIVDVRRDPALADQVHFIAWTHDVFEVDQEMVSGVRYVAVSEERQRIIAQYFHQPISRISVTLNAVNLRRMLDLSPETDDLWSTFRLSDEDFVAFYPVRLTRNKNIEGAVDIVAALNRLGQRTTLLVPGVTEEWQRGHYNELRELASVRKIPERVIFLTDLTFKGRPFQVTDDVIRDLYKLASFLLFTSRDEGFGLPLIEAASWRLPAVISPIPSLVTISQGAGTLVVDPDHEAMDQIASRIIDYLTGNPIHRMQRRVFSLYNISHQFETMGWRLPTGPDVPRRIGTQTTNYYLRLRVEDQFLDAIYNGLNAFEVFFDPQPQRHTGFNPEDLKEDVRHWLREQACKHDVYLSVYARRQVPDPAERLCHWRECLTFADHVGAAILVIDFPPPATFSAGDLDCFVRDLQQVIDMAYAFHILIAVENGSCEDAAGTHLLTSAENINDLFMRLGRARNSLGVSFNAGRAHLLEDPVFYLRKIHPPIVHVKLSDNQGPGHNEVHQRLGEGTIPLAPVLVELHRRGYRRMIILEYFYADLRRDRAMVEEVLSTAP